MKKLVISPPNIDVRYSIAFCFIVFFFPLIAIINGLTGISTNIISIGYRGVSLMIAIAIIILNKNYIISKKINRSFFLLIIFWLYYISKLLIDLFVFDLLPNNGIASYTKSYYLLQSVGICFLPMIAAFIIAKKINLQTFNKSLFYTFSSINIALILMFISRYGFDLGNYFRMRISINSENGNADLLNPITIGIYGGLLFITLLHMKINWLIKLPLISISVINIILSASLGPFLSLLIVILLFLLKSRKLSLIISIGLLILALSTILKIFIADFFLFERLTNFGSNESVSIRFESIQLAFEQIKSNIVLGTHFFVIKNGSSPHNLFIDILLSTGILGIALIIHPFFSFLNYYIRIIGNEMVFSISLFIFLLAQTSGYVFGLSDFWPMLAFCLGLVYYTNIRPNSVSSDTTNKMYQ